MPSAAATPVIAMPHAWTSPAPRRRSCSAVRVRESGVTPATAKSRIVRPSTGAFQRPTSMRPRVRVVATPAMRSAGAPTGQIRQPGLLRRVRARPGRAQRRGRQSQPGLSARQIAGRIADAPLQQRTFPDSGRTGAPLDLVQADLPDTDDFRAAVASEGRAIGHRSRGQRCGSERARSWQSERSCTWQRWSA
jgi:hypothetical protein